MPYERNTETRQALLRDIKALQSRCVDACNIIENAPPEAIDPENIPERTLCYVEGVRTEIQNSNTPITTDDNLLTNQFLNEIKEKTAQVEELVAFTRGAIRDADAEINRLKEQLKTVEEAKSRPRSQKQDVQPEHVQRAKDRFHLMKNELHGLINSLFPDKSEAMLEVLAPLMSNHMTGPSDAYVEITSENYKLIEILKERNIVSINPYNNLQVKLAYFIMTYINITSVKLFVKVQNVFGICKVLACLIVIGGGIYEIARGNTANLEKGFEGSTTDAGGIALALYSGLWAYDGWNSVTVVTEEIINPGVNVPLSISIAVPVITGLYVFMNVAYMAVLSYAEMTSVPAVAVAFGARVLGPASFLIPVGVAISTFGCAMSVQFGVTRVCYTAAQGGHMLELFSYVNIKRLTPAPAVAFQALLASIFIAVGNIKTLIDFASWFLWFFYGLAMVALLMLRRSQPNKLRPYRVPTPVPCFVLLVAVFLSILPIVHDPSMKYLMAIGFIVLGVGVYTVFVYYKKTPSALLKKLTFLTQVLFVSVPPRIRQD